MERGTSEICSSESREHATPGSSGRPQPPHGGPRGPTLPGKPSPSYVCSTRASNSNPRAVRRGGAARTILSRGGGLGHPVPDAPGAPQSLGEGSSAPMRGVCAYACMHAKPPEAPEGEGTQSGARRGAPPHVLQHRWYVPANSAPSRFPAPRPAWLAERVRRPHRGPELPWPSGGRRRGSGSAGARPLSPAAATRRTASLRFRQKMTPGPRR